METFVVALVVLGSALYLGRRARHALTGAACGCASARRGGGCPAASAIADEVAARIRDLPASAAGGVDESADRGASTA